MKRVCYSFGCDVDVRVCKVVQILTGSKHKINFIIYPFTIHKCIVALGIDETEDFFCTKIILR